MTNIRSVIEPSVINELMLKTAVENQGPQALQANKIVEEDGIPFEHVLLLQLDFRNILQIENLWQFKALRKLQLDNNIIEKIEGLEELKNLTWLDLSFNNIEHIEGLSHLSKLEDLSLYSNRITKLENLDQLSKLQVLSVGNNLIDDFENVLYLRSLKNVQCLNLAGNPVTGRENYRLQVAAHLSQLRYLDYRIISKEEKVVASEKYGHVVEELVAADLIKEKEKEEIRKEEEKRLLHKEAFVENFEGSQFFDLMFAEDKVGTLFTMLPGTEKYFKTFKEQFIKTVEDLLKLGLDEHQRRNNERREFLKSVEETVLNNRALGTEKVEAFVEYKNSVFQELQQLDPESENPEVVEKFNSLFQEFHRETSLLLNELMNLEMTLIDQLEEIYREFEHQLTEMVNSFVELVHVSMAHLRELEQFYTEDLSELAMSCLERFIRNDVDLDLPEGLHVVFVNKDTVKNAVSSSHEHRLAVIDEREDILTSTIYIWMNDLLNQLNLEEQERNRHKVLEINHFIDKQREEVDENRDLASEEDIHFCL
ncbi:dynein regulatory complex subunit 3-like isoform X2 [Tachypleus tridentatus]|uniref:dynein regulatory complex subunit 3-like isoform X2 n=1 Tax=Tachypleus tridentatus TaxID=6853 RepID=UPI003FD38005